MNVYRYVLVVLALSMVAAAEGRAVHRARRGNRGRVAAWWRRVLDMLRKARRPRREGRLAHRARRGGREPVAARAIQASTERESGQAVQA